MAQDGLARAIRPVHTPLDGDIVFVGATGMRALADPTSAWPSFWRFAADNVRPIARGM